MRKTKKRRGGAVTRERAQVAGELRTLEEAALARAKHLQDLQYAEHEVARRCEGLRYRILGEEKGA